MLRCLDAAWKSIYCTLEDLLESLGSMRIRKFGRQLKVRPQHQDALPLARKKSRACIHRGRQIEELVHRVLLGNVGLTACSNSAWFVLFLNIGVSSDLMSPCKADPQVGQLYEGHDNGNIQEGDVVHVDTSKAPCFISGTGHLTIEQELKGGVNASVLSLQSTFIYDLPALAMASRLPIDTANVQGFSHLFVLRTLLRRAALFSNRGRNSDLRL
eukprot:1141323-Pelagomonas_calceolata.AAC.4